MYRKLGVVSAIVLLAACSNDKVTTPINQNAAKLQAIPDEVLERIPLVASKNVDNSCDWAGAVNVRTQQLLEKYKGSRRGTLIVLEDQNQSQCSGNLTVKFSPKVRDALQSPKKTRKKVVYDYPAVAAVADRPTCLSLMSSQGIAGYDYTAQAMIKTGVSPYVPFTYVEFENHTKRVNVGGNGGMNCIRVDSAFVTYWADGVEFFEAGPFSPSPQDQTPYDYSVINEAPANPLSFTYGTAFCTPGSCLASLYTGVYKRYFNSCPNIGYGVTENREYSVKNANYWSAYYYVHLRTDGVHQTAGWGYPNGYPGSGQTCTQLDGFPRDWSWAVLAA